jgi:hypothetical protein
MKNLDATDVGLPIIAIDGVLAVGTEPRNPDNVRDRVILVDVSDDAGNTRTARLSMEQAQEAVRLLLDAMTIVRLQATR